MNIHDRAVQQRGVAAVAVIDGRRALPEAAWRPSTLPIEPLFLAHNITKSFAAASLQEMTTLIRVPGEYNPWGEPSYGLGIMGDPASPLGLLWGHNGGGPGYSASAFHVPNLQGRAVTVCVMSAIEEGFGVEEFAIDLMKRINAT